MNIENYLKSFKKDYQKTQPTEKFLQQGWEDLQEKIDQLKKPPSRTFFYLRPIAFVVVLIFIFAGSFAGIVYASQNSLPGEPLYPLKRLSEDIVSKASGDNSLQVDNRAEEIIDLSKRGSENDELLNQAVEEYREEVKVSTSSGNTEVQTSLESHEREFEEIKEELSESGSTNEVDEIDEAIEISRSGQGGGDEDEEDRSGSNSGKD